MQLRPYQSKLIDDIYQAWANQRRNVLAVMATGAGKSVVIGKIINDLNEMSVTIAHREELVNQLSGHLAREGIRHRVIAPKAVVRRCAEEHRKAYGESFVDVQAPAAVAGVDTLVSPKRVDALQNWIRQVRTVVIDEAAHVLDGNKWGRAVKLFPNALNLGVTATPTRADGNGLGIHASGVYDDMVIGPDTGYLIKNGYLSDYEILLPESDLDVSNVNVTASGDFSPLGLRAAVTDSHIVGDVVQTYTQYAAGKRNVVFATDVETSEKIASAFCEAGIAATSITGNTATGDRQRNVQKFRDGEIQVLVSVDIFDEGFDLPAIEVVQMARPTWSLGKYLQQIGRGLRLMDGKDKALIIDHVSNVRRHGLPDAPRAWTLNDREKRSRKTDLYDEVEPVNRCANCLKAYSVLLRICPYCKHEPVQLGGGRTVKEVDGDLKLLAGEELDRLRSLTVLESPDDVAARASYVAGPAAGAGARARQREKLEAQASLMDAIAIWAGYMRHYGYEDFQIDRKFYHAFGYSVPESLAMKRTEMQTLTERLDEICTKLTTVTL